MRLLKREDNGGLVFEEFSANQLPLYAVLSHTWAAEKDEVTLEDLKDGTAARKPGYQKLHFCAERAKLDSLNYFWIDTCCIRQSNQNELTEAINSMFQWYENAERCYVYLSDVVVYTGTGDNKHFAWEERFCGSRWFRRGWTLQELLAPKIVEFYSRDQVHLGNKSSLEGLIHRATRVPNAALQGNALSDFSITERLSWISKRETKRPEDKAYCLLGVFGINMPPLYGEGESKAFRRLRREIKQLSDVDDRGDELDFQKPPSFTAYPKPLSMMSRQLKNPRIVLVLLTTLLVALYMMRTIEQRSRDIPTEPPTLDVAWPVFAVIGCNGDIKSSFIKTLGAEHIDTEEVVPWKISRPCRDQPQSLAPSYCKDRNIVSWFQATIDGQPVWLFDTAGDQRWDETTLRAGCERRSFAGVIFLQDITIDHAGSAILPDLNVLRKIIGSDSLYWLALVTANWRTDVNRGTLDAWLDREHNLIQHHWADLVKDGAEVMQFDGSFRRAKTIIRQLLINEEKKTWLRRPHVHEDKGAWNSIIGPRAAAAAGQTTSLASVPKPKALAGDYWPIPRKGFVACAVVLFPSAFIEWFVPTAYSADHTLGKTMGPLLYLLFYSATGCLMLWYIEIGTLATGIQGTQIGRMELIMRSTMLSCATYLMWNATTVFRPLTVNEEPDWRRRLTYFSVFMLLMICFVWDEWLS